MEQAIVNGSSQESYLGVGRAQVGAIVQVIDGMKAPDAGGPLCSGTFVTPAWVITAGHCLQIPSGAVVVAGEGSAPPTVLPVLRSVANPAEDVALLNVDITATSDASVDAGIAAIWPIAAGTDSVGLLAVSDVVEVAGYGVTESDSVGDLRFLAESITAVDASTITVSGFGSSGACEGDSGGPLLMRAPDGTIVVAAVLSAGSASCRGDDVYVRLDAIRDWIQETTGPYSSSDRDCGGITAQGRCLYGSAMWCSGGQLSATACSSGTRCGWDPAQQGYRCVEPARDSCDGVDSFGACNGDEAIWCNSGALARTACGCAGCGVDALTGRATCRSG